MHPELLSAAPRFRGLLAFGVLMLVAAPSLADGERGAERAAGRDYYEWRTYRVENTDQQERVIEHLETAALPAWKRRGVGPVGVFTEIGEGATPAVHVLLTFDSPARAASLRAGVQADPAYREAAADYLAAAKDDPAFARIESTLMVAFTAQQRIVAPRRGPRVFEMRTYESHSEAKAARKIEMFNAGEVPIFRDAGFETVFFGESLVGPSLPNLKYMVASPDMGANEASWEAFRVHPEWKALKAQAKYANSVSRNVKLFLVPTPFSEI